ncbi:helix-turn-helix transcriptional regulator [Streptomyces sp. DSM 44917]|uniref:Helix-turn-helix transcriptional regulator n=1 Tax=Streptomyces boetiae TaxID=3075541 RepID=A0ABU2L8J2_9ACTN|nr:helix-turn-helix transcriptional regulator [Streptomyces sp. DSM 44917]MDT0307895.1 helix-turn-helix transcriptional regulator [Streptomyces sp. DSM 44917]
MDRGDGMNGLNGSQGLNGSHGVDGTEARDGAAPWDNGRELGGYLRSRRARVAPESAGIGTPGGRRRRVRGLRREELAQLAGISVDYYVRLEQGRATQPSGEVLDALARALRLGETEREHLARLAAGRARRPPARPSGPVRPELRRVLDGMPGLPAVVVDERLDVLAWNRLGGELYCCGTAGEGADAGPPNLARFLFLDPRAPERYPDLELRRGEAVAMLRLALGRYPGDPPLEGLVAGLTAHSEEFRRIWAAGDVLRCGSGSKRFRHPEAGVLELDYETLHLPPLEGRVAQQVYVFSAPEGSPAEEALRLLAERTAALDPCGA